MRDMLRTSFSLKKITKGSNSVNTVDRVMILAICVFSDSHLLMCQVSFNSLVYFQRYTPNKLLIVKIKKDSNSVNTVDRVTVFALCTFADGPLSMYQVSLNSLVYLQRYAPDKLFIAKIKKGNNSLNTVDRVMVLALGNFSHGPLSVYQVSLNYLQYF